MLEIDHKNERQYYILVVKGKNWMLIKFIVTNEDMGLSFK